MFLIYKKKILKYISYILNIFYLLSSFLKQNLNGNVPLNVFFLLYNLFSWFYYY